MNEPKVTSVMHNLEGEHYFASIEIANNGRKSVYVGSKNGDGTSFIVEKGLDDLIQVLSFAKGYLDEEKGEYDGHKS